MRDQRVFTDVLAHPWALTARMRTTVATVLACHMARVPRDWTRPDPVVDVTVLNGAGDRYVGALNGGPSPLAQGGDLVTSRTDQQTPGVLVVPVRGVIAAHADLFTDVSAISSYDEISDTVRAGVADPKVGTIVLDINSPGGSAAGAHECAAVLLEARQSKRLVAQVNHECCSAAFWLACCAHEIVSTPSGLCGSVGVYSMHQDLSKALDQVGIKVTYVSEGEFKIDGNETEPLSETGRARMQVIVGHFYDLFTQDIAAGRGRSVADVRAGFGKGNVVTATEAVSLGMVDRIDTLDQTVARALAPAPPSRFRPAARTTLERDLLALGF
jgi:signal peptide peptidase SppA